MLKYLIEKEFKQILRNKFLPKVIFVFPVVMLLILPFAANYEIKHINLSVVDNDHSSYSSRLIRKITSSGYFNLTNVSDNYNQAIKSIEAEEADIILQVPKDFEKNLIVERTSKVMISANAVNGMKGGLGSSYLSNIINDFANEVRGEWITVQGLSSIPIIDIVPQNKFNVHLSYKIFMVPAIMAMLITLITGFLPAMNIVNEKELGTIEQINVSPVKKFTFIISKLIPYWIIGTIVFMFAYIIAWLVYDLTPAGHLRSIYVSTAIYMLGISGLGLIISNYSKTIQQAMFVVFFFMMVMILMSGLYTPISSMPMWAQYITYFNPLRYFIETMRSIYLKGSGIIDLRYNLYALIGFALLFNTWAVLSYRKSS